MTGPLSRAEIRVVKLIAYPVKVSAYRLGLHEGTVRFHLRSIERKLGAANRLSACVIAAQMGIEIEVIERKSA